MIDATLDQDRKLTSTDYNTVSGVDGLVSDGLEGLHRLIEVRNEAIARGEELDSFVVAGRILLSTYVGVITWDSPLPPLARTVSFSLLKKVLPSIGLTSTLGAALPKPEDRCAVCGFGWHLFDCHDSRCRREGDTFTFRHTQCAHLQASQDELGLYHSLFAKLTPCFTIRPIPNEYHPSWADWAEVCTPFGTFKIGRRKRVYELSWVDVRHCAVRRALRKKPTAEGSYDELAITDKVCHALHAETLFEKESVTKGANYIHAWSDLDLQGYLSTLLKAVREVWG